jgi:zinc protease
VNAPVQTDRTADSLAELVRELGDINAARPIGEDEMARVIAGLTRELPGRFETSTAVLNSLVSSAQYGRPLDYAATLATRYAALDLGDLQSAAQDYVEASNLVWVVVGDLEWIREPVEALGIGPVEIWNDDGERVAAE